jgi:FMN phosphatase YigB (HAD superfamily)
MSASTKRLLITDLDNTLYDWVTFFAQSFTAMIDEASRISGIERDMLLDGFQVVHKSHHNSEYPFAILEVECLRKRYGEPKQILAAMDEALHAFNRVRNQTLHLYPTVKETLRTLTKENVLIVGHTEAIAANAYYRLRKLGIADLFRKLYVLHGPLAPHPKGAPTVNEPPNGLVEEVPLAERKPNPRLLLDICQRLGIPPSEAVYVGDSKTRDISMAIDAGVTAVWASYGTKFDKSHWETLVRVTHWSEEDVLREQELRRVTGAVVPDHEAHQFSDILTLFAHGL